MRCIDCMFCDLRSKPEMARRGFAQCKYVASWEYPSVTHERECAKFAAATQKAVEDRTVWFAKQAELAERQAVLMRGMNR